MGLVQIDAWQCVCGRCGHRWISQGAIKPIACAKCKNVYWDRPRMARESVPLVESAERGQDTMIDYNLWCESGKGTVSAGIRIWPQYPDSGNANRAKRPATVGTVIESGVLVRDKGARVRHIGWMRLFREWEWNGKPVAPKVPVAEPAPRIAAAEKNADREGKGSGLHSFWRSLAKHKAETNDTIDSMQTLVSALERRISMLERLVEKREPSNGAARSVLAVLPTAGRLEDSGIER